MADKNESFNNGRRTIEIIVFIVQTAILLTGIVYSYATMEAELKQVKATMWEHVQEQPLYVREDVWKTRNQFIDEKLDDISRKLDLLIMARSGAKITAKDLETK